MAGLDRLGLDASRACRSTPTRCCRRSPRARSASSSARGDDRVAALARADPRRRDRPAPRRRARLPRRPRRLLPDPDRRPRRARRRPPAPARRDPAPRRLRVAPSRARGRRRRRRRHRRRGRRRPAQPGRPGLLRRLNRPRRSTTSAATDDTASARHPARPNCIHFADLCVDKSARACLPLAGAIDAPARQARADYQPTVLPDAPRPPRSRAPGDEPERGSASLSPVRKARSEPAAPGDRPAPGRRDPRRRRQERLPRHRHVVGVGVQQRRRRRA